MPKIPSKKLNFKVPSLAFVLVVGLLLLIIRLVLCSAQQMLLSPDEAGLDDMLMYDAAVSITKGQWLGLYGWKTLSKHTFFALWLAGLHGLGIPYLMGGQLLWAAACLAAAAAFSPLFKNRWYHLGIFFVLLYSPSSVANPAPNGYIARVYRDNIFPSLCLLCVAGMVGYALRTARPLRSSLAWLLLAGAAFAACWLCREDGWWISFFMVAAAVVALVYILRKQGESFAQKLRRIVALLLPFMLLCAGVFAWCAQNNAVYGRFIVSDFSSGEFADAYGAITRIQHENWNPKVAIPQDVRQKLYANVPAFAQLRPYLESQWYLGRYAGEGDYTSGAFYWALREAAAQLGYYDSPEKAKDYFATLAQDINALCDDGTFLAGPRRSSVSPPIRAQYIGPVLAQGLYSIAFCAVFAQCDARSIFSDRGNNPVFYTEKLAPMESFLHGSALTVTQENTAEPYFSPKEKLFFLALDIIRFIYAALLPCAFLLAMCWQIFAGIRLFSLLKKRQAPGDAGLLWLVQLGLLLCILLRAFMVAFVTVSSFTIGTYIMYLASIHPLMLLFAFVGTANFIKMLIKRRTAAVPVA